MLVDLVRAEGLDLSAIATTGDSQDHIDVPTEIDVLKWADACTTWANTHPVRLVHQAQRTEQPDIGIILTSATVETRGWIVEIRHVHRTATIPDSGTESESEAPPDA